MTRDIERIKPFQSHSNLPLTVARESLLLKKLGLIRTSQRRVARAKALLRRMHSGECLRWRFLQRLAQQLPSKQGSMSKACWSCLS